MSVYTRKDFWTATAERAIKTCAQSLITLIGTEAVGILDLDWAQILSVAGTMTLLSILTSVASGPVGDLGPAAAGPEAITPPVATGVNDFELDQARNQDELDEREMQGDLSDEADYTPEPVGEES